MSRALRLRSAPVGAALLLIAGCAGGDECAPRQAATGTCHDLRFLGRDYDEWHEVDRPPILQEVGNATYPACNAQEACGEDELNGFGATDVWLLDGAEVTDAVIGLREGTHTYVLFVRVGVDVNDLPRT